jgi:Sel1 repeat
MYKSGKLLKIVLLIFFILIVSCFGKSSDSASDLLKEAEELFNVGKNEEAFELYLKAAKKGSIEAQSTVGFMYEIGDGINKDVNEAVKWYTKAAEQGDVQSQDALGYIYLHGEDIEKDYKQALKWYQLAAKSNYPRSQYYLGKMYLDGQGVEQDITEAVIWLGLASNNGFVKATSELKSLKEELLKHNQVNPTEITIDTDKVTLDKSDHNFTVNYLSKNESRNIVIPIDMLIPSDQQQEEQECYMPSSFDYEKHVTSFTLGNGLLGLHLSSYHVAGPQDGSMQLCHGRDQFLVLDTNLNSIRNGMADLGLTKERFRNLGCVSAKAYHFILSDINTDNLIDIGIIREELFCEISEDSTYTDGPLYEQYPVHWFIFVDNRWIYDQSYDNSAPKKFKELPLIYLHSTPVDFVAVMLWNTYDPFLWETEEIKKELFIPQFRKDLMNNEKAKLDK